MPKDGSRRRRLSTGADLSRFDFDAADVAAAAAVAGDSGSASPGTPLATGGTAPPTRSPAGLAPALAPALAAAGRQLSVGSAVDFAGFLAKQDAGEKVPKQRWFELRGAHLAHGKDRGAKVSGEIYLAGALVSQRSDTLSLDITFAESSAEKAVVLSSETPEEIAQWLRALSLAASSHAPAAKPKKKTRRKSVTEFIRDKRGNKDGGGGGASSKHLKSIRGLNRRSMQLVGVSADAAAVKAEATFHSGPALESTPPQFREIPSRGIVTSTLATNGSGDVWVGTAEADGAPQLQVWRPNSDEPATSIQVSGFATTMAEVAGTVWVGFSDGTIRTFSVDGLAQVSSVSASSGEDVTAICLSGGKVWSACGAAGAPIRIWHKSSSKQKREVALPPGSGSVLALLATSETAADSSQTAATDAADDSEQVWAGTTTALLSWSSLAYGAKFNIPVSSPCCC